MTKKKDAKKNTKTMPNRLAEIVKPKFVLLSELKKMERYTRINACEYGLAMPKTLKKAIKRIETLEDIISEAAPLTWVVGEKQDEAQEWEKKAYDLLRA